MQTEYIRNQSNTIVNNMFAKWSENWKVDRYINSSANVDYIEDTGSKWKLTGSFNFNRPFTGKCLGIFTAYVIEEEGNYKVSSLCYDYNGEESCY